VFLWIDTGFCMQQKDVDLFPIGPPSAAPLERDEGGFFGVIVNGQMLFLLRCYVSYDIIPQYSKGKR